MKILLVGNANQKHRGARYYDQCPKIYNGLVRGGHNVLFMSDRDIARMSFLVRLKSVGKAFCNRYFLDCCANFKPDMIVLHHADLITAEALLRAKELLPAVRIAQFNVDIIFNEHNAAQIAGKLDAVDATFCTTAGEGLKKFSRPGKLVSYIPNATDSSIEWPRCFAVENPAHDVFWALRALKGSEAGDRRIDYPLYLEKNGVAIDYYGMNGKPLLYNALYFETIAKAKMGINISQIWTRGHCERAADKDLYLYSSDRISHYMGSGLLTFTTRDNKLDELFSEDRELVFFDSKEELLDKIIYYTKNDRQRRDIAKAGWEKYHACFNERLVAQYITERTLGMPLSHDYQWPVTCW